MTYTAIRDAGESINTMSARKTGFWNSVRKLFGASLAPNTGLTGNSMPGLSNQPQPMKWDGALNQFTADGAGFLQVNARVPAGAPSGPAQTVTIAVQ